jgi:predicted glycosyltransferase
MTFCATGKSGLGHLRRITNVVQALQERQGHLAIDLMTNAPFEGLASQGFDIFDRVDQAERAEMAGALTGRAGPIIVDTAVLPGLEDCTGPLCLILRETIPEKVGQFRLAKGRPWDLVLIPNPADHWAPDSGDLAARTMAHCGWIYRRSKSADAWNGQTNRNDGASARPGFLPETQSPTLLIASGGGGKDETARDFRSLVGGLLAALRQKSAHKFCVLQALGPLAPQAAMVEGVDQRIDSGGRLNEAFDHADLVISTCGYNSILELACSRTPSLLLPIARSIDDQALRARHWGPLLGLDHDPQNPAASVHWMAEILSCCTKRAPVNLPPSGAGRAAELLAGLL